jgi:hypothetical protein
MAHIADPNLRLLLLQAAWDENLIPRFDKAAFFRDQLHEELTDDAECNYRIDTRVLDALLAIPLTDETLFKTFVIRTPMNDSVFAAKRETPPRLDESGARIFVKRKYAILRFRVLQCIHSDFATLRI